MKKLLALLLCLAVPFACALAEENAPLPYPADGEALVRLTDEGHYLWLPDDAMFLEGDEESAAAGFIFTASTDPLDVDYRHDASDGLTLELYAQALCAQEGFTAESLRLNNVDCVRLTPLDTDEGFFAILWLDAAGEVRQLQFTYEMDSDDGFTLAEKVMNSLALYVVPEE